MSNNFFSNNTFRQINLYCYHMAVNIICIYAVAWYERITNYFC